VRTSVNLAALDTMIDHLHALCLVQILISMVVIEPEAKNQEKTGSEINQEEDVYIQSYHRKSSPKKT